MIDGNLVGYSKSGNEFMTLTMKNGILFGTYHLAKVYKGEIELRKNKPDGTGSSERRKREAFQQRLIRR
jgi:hypothetical protein